MAEFVLPDGTVTLVDDIDAEALACLPWRLHPLGYVTVGGKNTMLHRVIMRAGAGQHVDHRDGNKLNNTRSNLRLCSKTNNNQNVLKKVGASGYKGVQLRRGGQRYTARIRANGKEYLLGDFGTAEEAALAYDEAAVRLHGEFACINGLLEEHRKIAARCILGGAA